MSIAEAIIVRGPARPASLKRLRNLAQFQRSHRGPSERDAKISISASHARAMEVR